MSQFLVIVISVLVPTTVVICVFLLLRTLMLWYWKVDSIIGTQYTTNKLLAEQNTLLAENNAILTRFVDDFMNK